MRTLHRWVSTFAIVFLCWISLTGVLLALDSMWPPGELNGPRPQLPASSTPAGTSSWINDIEVRLPLHNLLQDLHRGSIIGIPGQIIDVLAGLCFIFLSVSGAIMYFDMLKRRRKSGNKALFWAGQSSMRSLHRYLGSALMLLVFYLSVTGTATGVAQLLDPESTTDRPPGEPPMPFSAGPPPGVQLPDGPRTKQQAQAGMPPPPPGQQSMGLPAKGEVPLPALLQDIHSGKIAGLPGQWAMLISGLCSVVLCLTGTVMFFSQWSRRRHNGHKAVFWK